MNRFRKYFFRFYLPNSSCCPLCFSIFPLHRRIHPHSHPRLFFLYPRKTYPCRLQVRTILLRSLRRSVSAPESFSCSCTFPFSSLSPFPGFFPSVLIYLPFHVQVVFPFLSGILRMPVRVPHFLSASRSTSGSPDYRFCTEVRRSVLFPRNHPSV